VKNYYKTSLPIFFFVSLLFGQQTVLTIPWGAGPAAVGLRRTPEGLYGPQSFRMEGTKLQILDNANRLIKIIENGRLLKRFPASAAGRDFVLFSEREYAVTVDNTVFVFKDGKKSFEFRPAGRAVIRALQRRQSGEWDILLSNGNAVNFGRQRHSLKKGRAGTSGGERFFLVRKNASLAEIQLLSEKGRLKRTFELNFDGQNLASLQMIGRDEQKRMFIHIELFESQIPLKVQRRVFVLDSLGNTLAVYKIPLNDYAAISYDLFSDRSGNLYQLLARRQGIRILHWNPPLVHKSKSAVPVDYPKTYDERIFNSTSLPECPESKMTKNTAPLKISVLPSVTPNEALSIGDSYVQLHWDCQNRNMTSGVITDSYGYKVDTPNWLYAGRLQRVPYKWGGFQTLQQFIDGVNSGKYAGDTYTSKSSGTPSAVGVDCSGFVSRCWKLPQHYSTRSMPDITGVYDNWDLTRPADACHKVGHVRLIVAHQPDGTLDMVEAAGFNWRVSYTNYRYSDITAYLPRYYIHMEGTPGNIPQPVLWDVRDEAGARLQWQAGSREAIYKFRLTASAEGENWTQEQMLSADSSRCFQPLAQGKACYYRLYSVAASDQTSSGTPSDAYGVYRAGSQKKVLIVDGFDRTAASGGSWMHTYHSFAVTQGRALEHYGIPFETADNDALLDGTVRLNNYTAVFWILGDESTYDETFDANEQALVSAYLKQGGKLFVSGSEIGWDLDHKGSNADKSFYRHFLKAAYKEDDSRSYSANGSTATPFKELKLHYDDGTHGVYQEDFPDVIDTLNGSHRALLYGNGKTAAVYFSGRFPQGDKAGQLFYLAFPFETIYTESERLALTGSVLNFFGFAVTDMAASVHRGGAHSFKLLGNYPNPFNGQTTIRFFLPSAGSVQVEVFTVLGRRVWRKHQKFSTGGSQTITLQMLNIASGEYLYRLHFRTRAGILSKSGRFILLK